MKSNQILIAILAALLFSSCSANLTKSDSVNLTKTYIKNNPEQDNIENCGKDYIDGILSQKISIDNEIKIHVTKVNSYKRNKENMSYDSLTALDLGIINIPELKDVIKNYNDYDSVLISYDYVINKISKIKIYGTVITLKNKTKESKIYLDFACTQEKNYLVYIGLARRKLRDMHGNIN